MENMKKTFSHFMKIKKYSSAEAPSFDDTFSVTANEIAIIKSKEENRVLPLNNPHREREILENIDAIYYSESGFDSSKYELQKLPEIPDVNQINADRKLMREQLSVVTKKISDFILENYPSYSAELRKVTELQLSIKNAFEICQSGRRRLGESESVLTVAGLNILKKYRKRQRLLNTFDALTRIKTLQETDMKLRELLEEDNIVSAIQLCLECRKAAEMYKEYTCISELTNKLQDTVIEIENHLDRVLAGSTVRLDLERYSRIIAAYEILNKTEIAADRLVFHFNSVISSTAYSVVREHCTIAEPSRKDIPFNQLCKLVPTDQFVLCLQELLKLLWQILYSYHCFIWWHKEHSLVSSSLAGGDATNSIVRIKLESNLQHIWQDASAKVDAFVQALDLGHLKFNSFLQIVDFAQRFVEIGVCHFACDCETLQETLKDQSLKYFKSHHRACLEELKMFLETEEWKLLPMPHHFSYKDLPEFSFVAKFNDSAHNGVGGTATNFFRQSTADSNANGTADFEFKLMDPSYANPFDHAENDEINGSAVKTTNKDGAGDEDSDESDVNEELAQEFLDDAHIEQQKMQNLAFKRHNSYKSVDKISPFVCNSSLNLLRLFGRYLHIANILTPISFDIITWLSQLLEYYIYFIYKFFGMSHEVFGVCMLNEKLETALSRIRNNVNILSSSYIFPESIPAVDRSCRLSSVVDLSNPKFLYGLTERIVGVESLIFVTKQLISLKPVVEDLVPSTKKAFIQQFYMHTVNVATELRRPVYGAVSTKVLNVDYLLNSINVTNWEICELMSQHNQYIDFIVKDMDNFRQRLLEATRRIHVPREGYEILWDLIIRIVNRILVEGLSNAKKCTHEGRALMQLDYQQLLLKLESLVTIRPIPDKEFVESYIKAFYLPESSMEQWISEHKEYSSKQIISLLHIATHISKKTRQRVISTLHQHDVEDVQ